MPNSATNATPRSLVIATAAVCALSGGAARADDASLPWSDEVGQWFLMPYVGETFVDDDRLLDDDLHYGLALGKHLSEDWSLQLNLYGGEFDADRSPAETPSWPASFDGSINGGSFDLMRVFARSSRFSPYLLGGIGMQRDDYEGLQGDDNVTAAIGLGAMWDLYRSADGSRTVQLRPEVRTRWDMQSGNTLNDLLAQVGVSFGWGPPRPAPAPETAPPPPPPPPPPAKCTDGDNDGVCDADDKCPGTAAGVRVDSVGCPLEQRLKLLFDFDSAELRPESIGELERLVKLMNDVPFATALIEGHTDGVGTDAYNEALSDRRAKAVFDYLTSRGVDPARLKSVGKGESEPIADNKTAEGRQENRRVIMIRTDTGR
jgi:OOP family OmpA-OmpF porin